ncbi:MAG: cytochrome P450 [Egibacteraceae bacterium]
MTTETLTLAPTTEDGGHKLLHWLREMRDERPVWRDQYGMWHVFRYADVERVTSDPSLFSSNASRVVPSMSNIGEGVLNQIDPPLHRKLRRLVSQAFTPKVVAGLAPRIAEVTNQLLDATGGLDEWDIVTDLAYPLPVIVIAELLGLPTSDRQLFRAWADEIFDVMVGDPNDPEFVPRMEAAFVEMRAYMREACLDRRARPRQDLISQLTVVEVDGERLTDNEVVSFSSLLLLAGHITTTALLGNTVLCLDEYPEALVELHADRSLVPAAVEEVLRYRSPIMSVTRVTTREAELSGTVIPPDVFVAPWILSANRDERVFADPDRFDIHRSPKQQVAFGHGVHFCLGAPLARLEARIAVNALLDRFTEIRVDRVPGGPLDFYRNAIFAARSVPITARHV